MISSVRNRMQLYPSQYGYNTYSNYLDATSFRGESIFNTPECNVDTIPINHNLNNIPVDSSDKPAEKQGLSKTAKWAIGLGLTAVGAIATKKIIGSKMKYQVAILKSALKAGHLPENIVFKKATTKEEALKFLKETLRVKQIDDKLSLEELNFISKSLTNVSNFNKGHVVTPHSIVSMSKEVAKTNEKGMAVAAMDVSIGKNMGTLEINQEFFKHENLDKLLKNLYYKENGKQIVKPDTVYKIGDNIYAKPDTEYSKLLEKFYSTPNKLSLEEKLRLIESREVYINNLCNLKDGKNIVANGVTINDKYKIIKMKLASGYSTIYHEMGHLQDLCGRLPDIAMNPFKYYFNTIRNNLNIFPTKAHSEFMKTQSIQDTAGKVSEYAKTSEQEFVAEVYARLVNGEKFGDDVMSLYKKYSKIS